VAPDALGLAVEKIELALDDTEYELYDFGGGNLIIPAPPIPEFHSDRYFICVTKKFPHS